jgi:hypothetical protein
MDREVAERSWAVDQLLVRLLGAVLNHVPVHLPYA